VLVATFNPAQSIDQFWVFLPIGWNWRIQECEKEGVLQLMVNIFAWKWDFAKKIGSRAAPPSSLSGRPWYVTMPNIVAVAVATTAGE